MAQSIRLTLLKQYHKQLHHLFRESVEIFRELEVLHDKAAKPSCVRLLSVKAFATRYVWKSATHVFRRGATLAQMPESGSKGGI